MRAASLLVHYLSAHFGAGWPLAFTVAGRSLVAVTLANLLSPSRCASFLPLCCARSPTFGQTFPPVAVVALAVALPWASGRGRPGGAIFGTGLLPIFETRSRPINPAPATMEAARRHGPETAGKRLWRRGAPARPARDPDRHPTCPGRHRPCTKRTNRVNPLPHARFGRGDHRLALLDHNIPLTCCKAG